MAKRKLIRVTTSDISLDSLIKGQLKFLSSEFEVIGVSNNTGVLAMVGEREGIRTIEVPMHREISLFSDIKCLWLLYRLFRKEKPDIVHANTPKGSMLSMIASKLAFVPHRLYTVTGLRYQGASGLFRILLMVMERISCYCATKVIPEGEGVKKTLLKDNITSKEMHIILNGNINGIDTEYFNPDLFNRDRTDNKLYTGNKKDIRCDLNLKEDDFVFIFIGRIVRDKGMNELAVCMKRFKAEKKNVKLLLVGRFESKLDPLDADNEEFLRSDPNIHFLGYQNDVRPFFVAADVLVFPSYREGFPNVVLQAGAMGIPAIVTNINGCNEIIKEDFNGKIFSSKDVNALYEKMNWCLNNKNRVKDMASQSRKMIVDRYRQEEVWEATLQEYKKLLK
ncbi:glycosyltransferase family 4 protein [Prevotella intermedia]|uniref:Glycosyltransferase family 1 protein n=1 Tax=Prevotella intermedia TaxID=28131 RepID=A0A2G8ICQ0_PREIN|nr:glycosyltransferase family 4 protein [Prevotella intermedia]PIK21231.1 glycosyltransferase family 1 protein [Prevotella intermedia]